MPNPTDACDGIITSDAGTTTILQTAANYKSWSWDPVLGSGAGGLAAATQRMLGSLVAVRAGVSYSNVVIGIEVASAGTVPTGFYVWLYTTAGVQLAVSANLASGLTLPLGPKTLALSSAYTPSADGAVYAGFLVNGTWGSTQPLFLRNTGPAAAHIAATGGVARSVFQDTQATPPTPAAFTATTIHHWVALN